jgi:phage terminase small subunit
MSNHELAEKDYILGMSFADIAKKYGVAVPTAKSWKQRYGWSRDKTAKKNASFASPKNKKGCIPKNRGKPEPEPDPEEELSDQEILFCHYHVQSHNATQAALKAGYGKGNKVSAQVIGSRLYSRQRIKKEIERLRELILQDVQFDIRDLLAFCMKVVGADIGDYLRFGAVDKLVYDDNGPIKDPDTGEYLKEPVNCISLGESEMLDTSVISEVKQGKDGISIKLADKKWAWEQLRKHFDWLPDQWQRKVEGERLDIERRKVEAVEKKNGNDMLPDGEEGLKIIVDYGDNGSGDDG